MARVRPTQHRVVAEAAAVADELGFDQSALAVPAECFRLSWSSSLRWNCSSVQKSLMRCAEASPVVAICEIIGWSRASRASVSGAPGEIAIAK